MQCCVGQCTEYVRNVQPHNQSLFEHQVKGNAIDQRFCSICGDYAAYTDAIVLVWVPALSPLLVCLATAFLSSSTTTVVQSQR